MAEPRALQVATNAIYDQHGGAAVADIAAAFAAAREEARAALAALAGDGYSIAPTRLIDDLERERDELLDELRTVQAQRDRLLEDRVTRSSPVRDANRIDQMLQALTDRAVDDSRVNAQDFQHFMALRDGIRDLLHVDRDLEDQADRAAEREEEITVTTEVLIESEGATPLAVHALTAAVDAGRRVGELETTVLGRADRYLEWLREQAQPDG